MHFTLRNKNKSQLVPFCIFKNTIIIPMKENILYLIFLLELVSCSSPLYLEGTCSLSVKDKILFAGEK